MKTTIAIAALLAALAATTYGAPITRNGKTDIDVNGRLGGTDYYFTWDIYYSITYDMETFHFQFDRWDVCSDYACNFRIQPFEVTFETRHSNEWDIVIYDQFGQHWYTWFGLRSPHGDPILIWGAVDDDSAHPDTLIPGRTYDMMPQTDWREWVFYRFQGLAEFNVVPEPSGLLLSVVGIVCGFGRRWRR